MMTPVLPTVPAARTPVLPLAAMIWRKTPTTGSFTGVMLVRIAVLVLDVSRILRVESVAARTRMALSLLEAAAVPRF